MGMESGGGGLGPSWGTPYSNQWAAFGGEVNSDKNTVMRNFRQSIGSYEQGVLERMGENFQKDPNYFKNNDITVKNKGKGNDIVFSSPKDKYEFLKNIGDSSIDVGIQPGTKFGPDVAGGFAIENYNKLKELTGYTDSTATDSTAAADATPSPAADAVGADSNIPVTQGSDLTDAEKLLRQKSGSSILSTGI